MVKKTDRKMERTRRHLRVRTKVSGTSERPRLCVYRSNANLYVQIIDDVAGNTLVSCSTLDKDIKTKADLLSLFQEYNVAKREYNQIKYALNMVKQTGYGIATPSIDDMKLDKPEIIKQGPRYGVKLKAVAPSIHMIKVDVESTFEPIIGSETQCKELIDYLTKDKETDKNEIWKSEIFGRSLDSIVQEGIQSKINLMPDNIRFKLQNTLTRVVNKGSNNVITIVI